MGLVIGPNFNRRILAQIPCDGCAELKECGNSFPCGRVSRAFTVVPWRTDAVTNVLLSQKYWGLPFCGCCRQPPFTAL
jgi:hypothetical protein